MIAAAPCHLLRRPQKFPRPCLTPLPQKKNVRFMAQPRSPSKTRPIFTSLRSCSTAPPSTPARARRSPRSCRSTGAKGGRPLPQPWGPDGLCRPSGSVRLKPMDPKGQALVGGILQCPRGSRSRQESSGSTTCGRGLIPMGSHFGVGAPPILVYFSGDSDVHWG